MLKTHFSRISAILVACTATWSALLSSDPASAETWRVGDSGQPWQLYPVSFLFDVGVSFRPEYDWGGQHAAEIVVDEDGDGLIDEDRVDLVDNDGDGLYNEDPENGIDDDRDGLLDEDGPDLQIDNDGDGLLNEDGFNTGGVIYDPDLRDGFTAAPFFRYATPEEAAADAEGWGSGYGWGDDDYDGRFNEDLIDGEDNDGDGLIDEDGAAPVGALPAFWSRSVFSYDVTAITDTLERQALRFALDADRGIFWAVASSGDSVVAQAGRRSFNPTDWIRPVRLDSQRNVVRIAEDRFLNGLNFSVDPMDSQRWGARLTGTDHVGEAGHGQVVDGNIFTARVTSQRSSSAGFRADLGGLYFIDLIRLRPRPDFGDRTPTSFLLYYGGDGVGHITERRSVGGIVTRLNVNAFVIPRQVDQTRPPIKEYRFDGGELGSPRRVRVLDMRSQMPEGQTWELAEFEAYGRGYAHDALYVTEIIDVGPSSPRFRRYFDFEDPTRPISFELIKTLDDNRNGSIDEGELASTKLDEQFDINAPGDPVTWGKVRWRGQAEGRNADVQVRVRSGTGLDTYIYQRRVGTDVLSPFIDQPLLLDWPARGDRIDASAFVSLSGITRPRLVQLPYNSQSDRDGIAGGWTLWTAPFTFEEGQVDESGEGGILLPLPPLTRYIQFRFDFISDETSGISLDFLEFEFASPFVRRGVVAEIFPDTTTQLGVSVPFQYVLKPNFANLQDSGFNRIDLVVPSLEAQLDSFIVDGSDWTRLFPPAGQEADKVWLDGLTISADETFAAAVYSDSLSGQVRLGLKMRELDAAAFPTTLDKDIRLVLRTPVFKLLTTFDSWVWNDEGTDILLQPADPGNAQDELPADKVSVTVRGSEELVAVRNIGPNPFSPNGDGINDEIIFDFGIFLLTEAVETEVVIYNLSGAPVRRLAPVLTSAGSLRLRWDGRNDGEELVPPGIYVYQLSVKSDTDKNADRTGTIGLAY